MCKLLKITRVSYYRAINKVQVTEPDELEPVVIKAFYDNKCHYGTRKIRKYLKKLGIIISRRRIARIMAANGLISTYTVKKYKPKGGTTSQTAENILNNQFDNEIKHDVIVSDLTYVDVKGKWHYICLLIDLFNREIIGYSCGRQKNAQLVAEAFMSANIPLNQIRLFHTDRGKEFDNWIITEILAGFDIQRSLSRPGTPHDNAVAEATYKTFKVEFCGKKFGSLEQLKLELFEHVWWYNNIRLHGSLGYMSPVEYRNTVSP